MTNRTIPTDDLLLHLARTVGLREVMHGVSAENAKALLLNFFVSAIRSADTSDVVDADFVSHGEFADDWAVAVQAAAARGEIRMLVAGSRDPSRTRVAAAERTLVAKGYTYTDGAELWEPPIGPNPFDLSGRYADKATPIELRGVPEVLAEDGGFWRTCSGCHESEDGHPVGDYPHSEILKCDLGGGCSECGGIGAVWDNLDYEAMGRVLEADMTAEEGPL